MKKNAKSQKSKSNKSILIQENKVKDLENNIISSPKNINLFNKIIELLIENLDNNDEKKINEIMNSLKNILTYYLMDKNIKSSKELISFFENKIELIYKIIFDLISADNANSLNESYIIIFTIFEELVNFLSNNKIKTLFQQLIEKIIFNKNEILENVINAFYDKFNNIFYYQKIFECLFDIIQNKKIKNEIEFNIFYLFVININDLDNFNVNEENKTDEEENNINKDNTAEVNKLKENYQNIITTMLNEKLLPLSIVKEFMKILNKKIIQNVNNPIIFSDYLIKKTSEIEIKSINDYDIQIFGLSSLFILLTKYNLDYDRYYELLYKLISQKFNCITIFDSKYKNRILKLIQLSLTSEQIPYVVICSFIKKLLRISLFAKVEIIYSLLSLVMKIIQLQPRTLNLIMSNKSKKILKKNIENNSVFINGGENTENLEEIKNCISLDEAEDEEENNKKGYDNFDEESMDPFNTNAEHCSLWELYSFTNHYNMGIRKLVNKFSRNFLAKEIEMEIKSQKDVYFDIKNLNAHFYINK